MWIKKSQTKLKIIVTTLPLVVLSTILMGNYRFFGCSKKWVQQGIFCRMEFHCYIGQSRLVGVGIEIKLRSSCDHKAICHLMKRKAKWVIIFFNGIIFSRKIVLTVCLAMFSCWLISESHHLNSYKKKSLNNLQTKCLIGFLASWRNTQTFWWLSNTKLAGQSKQ